MHVKICWWFICWDGKCCPVANQVDGRILKESQMSLVVTPRTGNSHVVGGEFPYDHLHLLVCGFPKDSCEHGVRHLGLDAVRRYRVGHD